MGNLYLSGLDFAKIGQVVVNNGEWQGKKILSASWIKEICSVNHDLLEGRSFCNRLRKFLVQNDKESRREIV
jgi:hypothetical protein